MLTILVAVAEFENDIRRERQRDGIEKAKECGVYRGRAPSIDRELITELTSQGHGATPIAKRLGISRASVYRLVGDSGGAASLVTPLTDRESRPADAPCHEAL
jgi:DNA invertase Pin-like site-specific DNA recombinase